MRNVFLAVDCGTQSLRAILFDSEGRLIRKSKIPYEPYVSPRPGWAEQDAEIYWSALCAACKELRRKEGAAFRSVSGVGVTTLRDTVICVDENIRPLRPAITWLDQRKSRPLYRPRGPEALAYAAVGMTEPVMKTQTDGKCNWIRQNQPEIWKKTAKFMQVSAFLNARLTGEFTDSLASQIGHTPFNYRKFRWSSRGELTAKIFPVEPDKLVNLAEPGTVLGRISARASVQTGIAVQTPVIACGSDKGCETLGSGCITEDTASLSFGTTGTVQTATRRYYEPIPFMPPYPACLPGYYNPEVQIYRGYWMIRWFLQEFGSRELETASRKKIAPEVLLNRYLRDVPAGSLGLTVLPYWSPGLTEPSAKGAMIGFGDAHGKAHIYRAIIEGLGYALKDGLRRIEKSGRIRIERLTVSGGGSQSDEVCQITADIFGMPVHRGRFYENSGLGAAIATAVGSGAYTDFPTAVARMTSSGRSFRPRAKESGLYRTLFDKVYSRIYGRLKPLYQDIRSATGYPEKI